MAKKYEEPTVESEDQSSAHMSHEAGAMTGQHTDSQVPEAHDDEPSSLPQSRAGDQVHQDPTDTDNPRSPALSKTELGPRTSNEGNIIVKDGIGRNLSFPFKLAMTWHVRDSPRLLSVVLVC